MNHMNNGGLMKSYVTPNDLKKIENTKGQILATNANGIVIVKTVNIFSVWNPEDGFIFCHTFSEEEAWEVFVKYSKREV